MTNMSGRKIGVQMATFINNIYFAMYSCSITYT